MDPTKLIPILELVAALTPAATAVVARVFKEAFIEWFRKLSSIWQMTVLVLRATVVSLYALVVVALNVAIAWWFATLAFANSSGSSAELPPSIASWLTENLALAVAIYIVFSFSILCYSWHKVLKALPLVMSLVVRVVCFEWDIKKFPKVIDYGYYFMGAVVLFNVAATALPTIEIPFWVFQIEIILALVLLSLKFTKVTLDLYPDDYLIEGVYIRSLNGVLLFPIKEHQSYLENQ